MKRYPITIFDSRKHYEGYLKCCSKINVGDMIELYKSDTNEPVCHKSPYITMAKVLGARGHNLLPGLALGFLVGFSDPRIIGWSLDRHPFDLGYSKVSNDYHSFHQVWSILIPDDTNHISGALIAKIHRK